MAPLDLASVSERELPYATQPLNSGRTLVTGYFGGWCILTTQELGYLQSKDYHKTDELYHKLSTAGVIIHASNKDEIIKTYVDLHKNLYLRPSLHIINTTNTCNYRCTYCHAGVSQGTSKMTVDTAKKVAAFIMENGENALTIEFQGGEALLNWDVLTTVTKEARRLNQLKYHKTLNICVVSNLSLMTDEKLDFLIDNDVAICTSLDGPAEVHDQNRLRLGGVATFSETIAKIKLVQDRINEKGKNSVVGSLCTVSRTALSCPSEIVDLYVGLGLKAIHLRALNNLGDAVASWKDLSYSGEEFGAFWSKAMDHIIELNKKGIPIVERGALFILLKILARQDPLYTEMMSPCGAGRGQILYNHDGGIYTCDEGRMLTEDIFRIGSVDTPGKDVLSNDDLINTWAASFLDLTCYHCAYRPWCGTCPVVNYQTTKNVVPNIPQSFWHKVYWHQFTYLFNKIDTEPETVQIFKKWIADGMW